MLAFVLRFLHGQMADRRDRARKRVSPKPAGDWVAAHGDWFHRAAQILFILGALAIALNLWRALGFPTFRYAAPGLLTEEARERRQDLEARAARLNQRVLALTAEFDRGRQTRRSSEPTRRRHSGHAGPRTGISGIQPCPVGRGA